MSRLRVLVADDEPIARRGLKKLLGAEPDVDVVGEARDGREAVAAIRRLKPDLAVLDVQMPELDGIGVVRELEPAELPGIVFVTAYDRYAIAAFDLHAVDYVLKPVQARRFAVALERARRRLSGDRPVDVLGRLERLLADYGRPGSSPDRILVRSGSKAFFVKLDEIEWFEASGNYVRLHTPARDPRALIRETLAHLARWLPPKFLRVHRSAIVNLDVVREVRTSPSGDGELLLTSGARVGLSRRHAADLHRRVGRPR